MKEWNWIFNSPDPEVIEYRLIKTNQRLTFDIISQHPSTRYMGDDDGEYFTFTASNGYQVISRSRMDIQTERLWLLGALDNERSGTMVFSNNTKRDAAFEKFQQALREWCRWQRQTNKGVPLS